MLCCIHTLTHILSHCENVVWHRLPCQKRQFLKELSWVKNTFFVFRLVCSNQQPASKPKEKKSSDHTDKTNENKNPLLKCEQVASKDSFQSRSSVSEVYVLFSPSLDTTHRIFFYRSRKKSISKLHIIVSLFHCYFPALRLINSFPTGNFPDWCHHTSVIAFNSTASLSNVNRCQYFASENFPVKLNLIFHNKKIVKSAKFN